MMNIAQYETMLRQGVSGEVETSIYTLVHPNSAFITDMASLRIACALILALAAVVISSPLPGGFGGGKHEHYVIHVPYHIHTVHHYKKVPVYIKHHTHTVIEDDHHHGGWHGWADD